VLAQTSTTWTAGLTALIVSGRSQLARPGVQIELHVAAMQERLRKLSGLVNVALLTRTSAVLTAESASGPGRQLMSRALRVRQLPADAKTGGFEQI
jgi:hypothetical protein